MKQKKPANAIFYGNYKDMIYNATPEQVKSLMVAFCQYAFDDIVPDVPADIALVWGVVKGNIDDDKRQYIARCEKNRENANKRYANKDTESTEDSQHTNTTEDREEIPQHQIKINNIYFTLETTEENIENIPLNGKEFLDDCSNDMKLVQKAITHGNKERWADHWQYYTYIVRKGNEAG